MLLGLTAYVFFVVAARAMGPERYAPLSVLWTLVFFAAPGFFFPLEQEVSRAVSARAAVGQGGGPVVRRAASIAAVFVVALVALCLALQDPIRRLLFDDQDLLFVALLASLPAYAISHLARGALSGTGRFAGYGLLLGAEGVIRVVAAVVLGAVGVATAGPFGLLVGLVPFASVGLALIPQRGLLVPGPEAPRAELSGAIGWLLLGAVLSQGFVNASVPVVKILASPNEQAIAGQFQAGLIISRVPLFLFQAVQAALLPKLAGLAASGRFTDFRTGLRRLSVVVVAIGIAATIGAFAVGPPVLRLLFGPEFDKLDRVDLGLLALASAIFMLAQALSQALIALHGHAKVAAGWAIAVTALAVTIALGDGLLRRVELGLVAGATVGVVALALLLRSQMNGTTPDTAEPLITAMSPEHEIVEP
ncbi:MAG: lipopolysaccharide biosynthesis protein [Acidimicrobiales bacterium]